MKSMPIQELPADECWTYVPDSDTWVVQKKSGNKKLSKNDYGKEAICPVCGEYKPTKYSPSELQKIDWACDDCIRKHQQPPTEIQELEQAEEMGEPAPKIPSKPTPEEHGSKEISTFDPEYQWLMKLITVVTKAGVPASEIKALAETYPFVTINDAGDLAAKIWSLATEKYNVPREWLIKKLPEKKGSLKHADADHCEDCGSPLSPYDEEFCNTCIRDRRRNSEVMDKIRKIQLIEHRFVNWMEKEQLEQEWDRLHPNASQTKKAYEGGYPTENDATTWGAAAPGTYAYQPNINHDAPTGLREGDDGKPIISCPKCKSDKVEQCYD